jgi:hypothetical protein
MNPCDSTHTRNLATLLIRELYASNKKGGRCCVRMGCRIGSQNFIVLACVCLEPVFRVLVSSAQQCVVNKHRPVRRREKLATTNVVFEGLKVFRPELIVEHALDVERVEHDALGIVHGHVRRHACGGERSAVLLGGALRFAKPAFVSLTAMQRSGWVGWFG